MTEKMSRIYTKEQFTKNEQECWRTFNGLGNGHYFLNVEDEKQEYGSNLAPIIDEDFNSVSLTPQKKKKKKKKKKHKKKKKEKVCDFGSFENKNDCRWLEYFDNIIENLDGGVNYTIHELFCDE